MSNVPLGEDTPSRSAGTTGSFVHGGPGAGSAGTRGTVPSVACAGGPGTPRIESSQRIGLFDGHARNGSVRMIHHHPEPPHSLLEMYRHIRPPKNSPKMTGQSRGFVLAGVLLASLRTGGNPARVTGVSHLDTRTDETDRGPHE